jgi:hypothetical protein
VFLQRALNCNLSELLAPLRKYVVMSSTTKKCIPKYDPTVPEVIAAVTVVKERIASSCTLVAPDYGKEFFLFVGGARSSGVGGVLTQFIDTGPPEDPVLAPTGGKKKYSELDRVIGLDKPQIGGYLRSRQSRRHPLIPSLVSAGWATLLRWASTPNRCSGITRSGRA